jgi:bacillithiol biosynthesis deacetylase BshB1
MTAVVDVLAFGAHPDDAELSVGGTLLKLKAKGYRTGVVDMTHGELGTRGTPAVRAAEAEEAARRLGLEVRRNLGLPDGGVLLSEATRLSAVRVIRECRPALILAPIEEDLHPDHRWTGRIVREAAFLSGLGKLDTGQPPHRPRAVLGCFSHIVRAPSLVVDITPYFARKKEACLAYRSQFFDPASTEPETYISRPEFWEWWEARARHFGNFIGARFGEAFVHDGPVPAPDLMEIFSGYGYYPKSRREEDRS